MLSGCAHRRFHGGNRRVLESEEGHRLQILRRQGGSASLAGLPGRRRLLRRSLLTDDNRRAIHLKLIRDDGGKPVDALHVHGHAPPDLTHQVEEALWRALGFEDAGLPQGLGGVEGVRNEPLAVTQLILVYHLLQLAAERS